MKSAYRQRFCAWEPIEWPCIRRQWASENGVREPVDIRRWRRCNPHRCVDQKTSTLGDLRNVSRGMDNLPANFCFCDFSLSTYWQNALDWRRDLNTLTFDLWRHRACRRCGSSYRIPVSSLNFDGLHLRKICCIFPLNIGLEALTFDFSKRAQGHPCHGLPSCQFSACYTLPFSTLGQTYDRLF